VGNRRDQEHDDPAPERDQDTDPPIPPPKALDAIHGHGIRIGATHAPLNVALCAESAKRLQMPTARDTTVARLGQC
jgi:hypothetical protein